MNFHNLKKRPDYPNQLYSGPPVLCNLTFKLKKRIMFRSDFYSYIRSES